MRFGASRAEVGLQPAMPATQGAPGSAGRHARERERTRGRRAGSALAAILASVGLVVTLGACSPGGGAGGPAPVNPDAERPFVLTGVSGMREIAQLTGPGAVNDTEAVGVAGTDLGSMLTVGERTYFFFGDTFGIRDPASYGGQGGMWRSNTMAWSTDDDPSDGITFGGWAEDAIGLAAALVEGDHGPGDGSGEVTKIPTHAFAIGDAMYLAYMSVSHWGDAGHWDAGYSSLAKSVDQGQSWTPLDGVRWPGDSNFIQFATAQVREGDTDFVYIWAIPAGRFGGVQLMRVPATEEAVEDLSSYSYFAGTDGAGGPVWSPELADAVTVLEPTIGEMSVLYSDALERWLMSYSDAGSAYIREGITPWGPWGEAIETVSGLDYAGLYGPYMNPRYVSDDGRTIFFTLSLWGPYNVFWFSVDLETAG